MARVVRRGPKIAAGGSSGTYVPPHVLTNADLEKMVDTTNEWILQRTGIRERHIVEPGVATSDIAEPAARAAIAEAGLTPDDIGFIVVGTTTPDTIFPSTACILQAKIGATNAWGFDLGAACSGFTYSLTRRMVDGGDRRRRARARRRRRRDVEHHRLHRSVDVHSVRRRRRRRGAVAGRQTTSRHIIDFTHEIDGTGGDALCMPAGGSRRPASHETVDERLHYVKQDGQTVFKFAVKKNQEIALRLLEQQRPDRRRPRPLRLAPGQSPHHRSHGRASGPGARQGRHQSREVRQHDGAARFRWRWPTRAPKGA